MNILTLPDRLLNSITMYRLVLYYLFLLLGAAFVACMFGLLPYSPLNLCLFTVLIFATSVLTNEACSKLLKVPTNVESVYITALILVLIISPIATTADFVFAAAAAALAVVSKFLLNIGGKHIFNPAAFGVAVPGLLATGAASWWVGGNMVLLPLVLMGGLAIVRKIRRFDLVLTSFFVALVTVMVTSLPQSPITSLLQVLKHSPIFFLMGVMLTEPLTMPATRKARMVYGAIVGFLFAPAIHIGSLYFTPELALLVGNIYAYLVSPKGRHLLTLVRTEHLGTNLYAFVFKSNRTFTFRPGQYLEWTLPHTPSDTRGNRRYFTIASSPTEKEIHLGIKVSPEGGSSFKQALLAMEPGGTLSVGGLSGDFTLPKDTNKKLFFIAGGIGITPFRSMVQYMLDTKEHRNVLLLYAAKDTSEFCYSEVFAKAATAGTLNTTYLVSHGEAEPGLMQGRVSADIIRAIAPDYMERTFYISGSLGMVENAKTALSQLGVPRTHIHTDYFPGF